MDERTQTIEGFLDALSSSAPTPGGGGVAALAGALAASLGGMVCSLTLGKPKYAAVEGDILRLQRQAAALQKRLTGLIAGDAEAFLPLSRAYGLPTETEAQKAHKAAVMEDALRTAAAVPLEILDCCGETAVLLDELKDVGSAIALSDVGCGAACCRAALESSGLNVYANTKYMKDRAYAETLNGQVRDRMNQFIPLCEAVLDSVAGRMQG